MTRRNSTLIALAIAVLAAPALQAQATRTWVSGVGDDANPCSRTAPCKTFAGAISKTAAGGEISVLDPGGFGAVTITKAITINGDGTLAGILNAGTNGVIINAGVNDRVNLRNISIHAPGTGLAGIRFLAGKSLNVEKCTISGFTTRGIDVSANTASTPRVFVYDTSITNGPIGIFLTNPGGGQVHAIVENVQLSALTTGLEAATAARAMVSNSVASGNSGNGIIATGTTARVAVEGSQIAFNDIAGVNASVSGAIIRISDNEIYNNNSGITIAAGATVESAGNNRVAGNVGTTAPNGTAIPLQ